MIKVSKNGRTEVILESNTVLIQIGDVKYNLSVGDENELVINKTSKDFNDAIIVKTPFYSNEIKIK